MTTVYRIDNKGNISELATYSLSPKEAIRNAFLQFVQNIGSTWSYDKCEVNIKEGNKGFHINYGDNSALFVHYKHGK